MKNRLDRIDREMMERCIALAKAAGAAGEYPYGAVIGRDGEVVAETTNRVKRDGDVTRHAEVVAISEAQKTLGRTTLSDCTIYTFTEPCPLCSFAIRESRIKRVVYGLRSPIMGGVSRWDILTDAGLCDAAPDLFETPPEIVAGAMAEEAAQAMKRWNVIAYYMMKWRGLFVIDPAHATGRLGTPNPLPLAFRDRLLRMLR